MAAETQRGLSYQTLNLIAGLLAMLGFLALWPVSPIRLLPEPIAEAIYAGRWVLLIGGLLAQVWLLSVRVRHNRRSWLQAQADAAAVPLAARHEAAQSGVKGLKVNWSPLNSGGANFQTQQLLARGEQGWIVTATWRFVLLCSLFGAIGGPLGLGIAFAELDKGAKALIPLTMGLVFIGISWALVRFAAPRKCFDRRVGWYWQGREGLTDQQRYALQERGKAAPLHEIRAVQVLAELVTDSEAPSYNSYELNLVLRSGQRLNVMDHGKRDVLVADAERLARWLDVPLLMR